MKRESQKKKRVNDIEQIDQQCMDLSVNLKENDELSTQDKVSKTPLSIAHSGKYRNNSVISGNNTFLSSEICS